MNISESPMYQRTRIATTFLRICALSVLWLFSVLPIVTTGTATMAAYHCAVKVIRRDRGKLLKEYVKALRDNLKNGTIIGCSCLLLVVLLIWGIQLSSILAADSFIWAVLSYVYFFLLVLLGVCAMFLVPFFSRFRMSIALGLKLSLISAFQHLFTGITCLLVWILAFQIIRFMPAMMIILPSCCFIVCSLVIEPILKKYTTASEDDDIWYFE